MTWTVVEGTYKDGKIFLKEKVNYLDTFKVLVLIPEQIKSAKQGASWEFVRQQIAAEMPDLLTMSEKEQQLEFDRLSAQIAQKMPYRSLEEFEKAMRGDEYDLARY